MPWLFYLFIYLYVYIIYGFYLLMRFNPDLLQSSLRISQVDIVYIYKNIYCAFIFIFSFGFVFSLLCWIPST